MVRKVLETILAVILAVLVFWISFAWTSACRLEREYEKEMLRLENEAH